MYPIRHILAAGLFAGLLSTAPAMAATAPNPLSVHVLDLQSGQPTAGIRVTLEQRAGEGWRALAAGVTNAQGRIPALFPEERAMPAGDYRIVFETGEHYARLKQDTFFPRIPVEFHVGAAAQHYHVPLLLSPFGYSTYRGN
ncbi:hydroxyisourate hydrolase [Pseudoduganella albidiflava]|uniref:5-hydroxyisourate hydrolase n=1 Tax=Pseudoduganella albidiflava TaxID=321983 RepID=A0A411X0T9_9BURK|nr:hydroxyisourate hydrolase [Pseudoduganella albidiflava]QBI02580.1 hydroxyisourate hydrolase [Pseudoduganella albidiflava]GGY41627.1 5-hydroxyisourate hydrolase [Pseudoduganella albidiflava]